MLRNVYSTDRRQLHKSEPSFPNQSQTPIASNLVLSNNSPLGTPPRYLRFAAIIRTRLHNKKYPATLFAHMENRLKNSNRRNAAGASLKGVGSISLAGLLPSRYRKGTEQSGVERHDGSTVRRTTRLTRPPSCVPQRKACPGRFSLALSNFSLFAFVLKNAAWLCFRSHFCFFSFKKLPKKKKNIKTY